MYCGCAADIVPLCDVMPGRRPASTELPTTGAEQFLCWGRGRPQVATEQVLLFPRRRCASHLSTNINSWSTIRAAVLRPARTGLHHRGHHLQNLSFRTTQRSIALRTSLLVSTWRTRDTGGHWWPHC